MDKTNENIENTDITRLVIDRFNADKVGNKDLSDRISQEIKNRGDVVWEINNPEKNV